MTKRRLFSKSDGTNTWEDLINIKNETISKMFSFIRKFGEEAEKVIDFIALIDDQIREGTQTDMIMDAVLAQIPGSTDEAIYKFIQDNLGNFIDEAKEMLARIDEFVADYESLRMKTASVLLQNYLNLNGEDIDRVTADTTVQVTYYLKN